MPTVLYIFGMRVVIYPNDHRPAHVHVIGDGCEAVFDLHCPDGPTGLRENYGFSKSNLSRIGRVLSTHRALLCHKWSEIHGRYE